MRNVVVLKPIEDNSTKGDPKLCAQGLNHVFTSTNGKTTVAIKNVNLKIGGQEFVAIVGPSGCGKSTLLNILAGLIKPSKGEVLLDGKAMNGISSRIGYMSQADSLLPWRTVLDNVVLGLEIKGVPKAERNSVARDLIIRTGLNGFEESYPAELSGGMRKRVAIIRILALDPEILFMDEPFGAIDVFTKEVLQDDILKLWQETKKTIVFVTHDLSEAITLADRVVLMTSRPSTIKSEYCIPIARPRSALETRFEPQFIELQKLIWNDLRAELTT